MKINCMLYLKLRLCAVLGHLQASTDVCLYAESSSLIYNFNILIVLCPCYE
jgi:hypothetical protein